MTLGALLGFCTLLVPSGVIMHKLYYWVRKDFMKNAVQELVQHDMSDSTVRKSLDDYLPAFMATHRLEPSEVEMIDAMYQERFRQVLAYEDESTRQLEFIQSVHAQYQENKVIEQ